VLSGCKLGPDLTFDWLHKSINSGNDSAFIESVYGQIFSKTLPLLKTKTLSKRYIFLKLAYEKAKINVLSFNKGLDSF